MCAIFGFYSLDPHGVPANNPDLCSILHALYLNCRERGRDASGVEFFGPSTNHHPGGVIRSALVGGGSLDKRDMDVHLLMPYVTAVLGNTRAEPTNEWVHHMGMWDVQPYADYRSSGEVYARVHAVHNGTIANDAEFSHNGYRRSQIDSQAIPYAAAEGWQKLLTLHGSIASAVYFRDHLETQEGFLRRGDLLLMRNYRPLSVLWVPKLHGFLFASKREYMTVLPIGAYEEVSLPPNSAVVLRHLALPVHIHDLTFDNTYAKRDNSSAVVVCSGGLDSTTVAAIACREYATVTLAHFHYGCRAQSKETEAVFAIRDALAAQYPSTHIQVKMFDLDFLKQLGGNPLVDHTMTVASAKEGVEYANEWVPFRNGLMLSMIVAYCDRWAIGNILLGANLEEAGAYGDNEWEFYDLMNRAVAIGSKIAPRIHNPLDTLMKREIVALATKIAAPIHLSWSCYHGGDVHCGACGPCGLRQTAFAMNHLTDPVAYANPALLGIDCGA